MRNRLGPGKPNVGADHDLAGTMECDRRLCREDRRRLHLVSDQRGLEDPRSESLCLRGAERCCLIEHHPCSEALHFLIEFAHPAAIALAAGTPHFDVSLMRGPPNLERLFSCPPALLAMLKETRARHHLAKPGFLEHVLVGPCARLTENAARHASGRHGLAQRGQPGIPERPHERPTAILTARFAVAFGPRRRARPVALRRPARNSIEVRLTAGGYDAELGRRPGTLPSMTPRPKRRRVAIGTKAVEREAFGD
jgi:hypothetical protein